MSKTTATICGLVAIVLWAMTLGLTRLLTEPLGSMTTVAGIYTTAGLLGCLWFYRTREARRMFARLPRLYLLGCGSMFTVYSICLYQAIGMASGRQQVLEVGVINYLWPGLTLVLSIPLLGKRPRFWFPLGALTAFAGVILAMVPNGDWDPAAFTENLRGNILPYALAFGAAFLWALYSNLVRRWAGPSPGAGIPVFFLATGLVMWVARMTVGEASQWSVKAVVIMTFMAIGPALLAYVFWDIAMRQGSMTLVASAAYLTPVLSALVSCLVLSVAPPVTLWIGCGLVVAGAVGCKLCLR